MGEAPVSQRLAGRPADATTLRRWVRIAPGVVAALVLGSWRLGDRSLWGDEAISAWAASAPWSRLSNMLVHGEPNMAVYYLLLRPWQAVSSSEVALRLPSVVAFVAAVPLVGAIARRAFGRSTAPVAAVLLGTSAFAIRYAQEARPYTLALALAAASSLAFLRLREHPGRARLVVWVVTSVLSVAAHLFAGFVVAAQLASVALDRRSGVERRTFVRPFVAVALLLVPLAFLVANGSWNRIDWIERPSPARAVRAATALTGYGGWTLLLLDGVLCIVAVLTARRSSQHRDGAFVATFLAMWATLPLALGLVLSTVEPVLTTRYVIVSLPAVIILTAGGLGAARGAWRPVLTGAVVAAQLVAVLNIYDATRSDDWRAAAAIVDEHAAADDMFIIDELGSAVALDHYAPDLALTPSSFVLADDVPAAIASGQATAWQRVWRLATRPGDERRIDRSADGATGFASVTCDRWQVAGITLELVATGSSAC